MTSLLGGRSTQSSELQVNDEQSVIQATTGRLGSLPASVFHRAGRPAFALGKAGRGRFDPGSAPCRAKGQAPASRRVKLLLSASCRAGQLVAVWSHPAACG